MQPCNSEIVGNLCLKEPFFLDAGMTILEAIVAFRRGKRHVAMICDDPILAAKYDESNDQLYFHGSVHKQEPTIFGKWILLFLFGLIIVT